MANEQTRLVTILRGLRDSGYLSGSEKSILDKAIELVGEDDKLLRRAEASLDFLIKDIEANHPYVGLKRESDTEHQSAINLLNEIREANK